MNTQRQKPQTQPAQAGPIGNRQPGNRIQPPIEPEQKPQQEPSSVDTETDANRQIQQEPNVNGPVVNEPIDPQKTSTDELMSNDDFRKMLQRNLEITDQEKQRRQNKKNQTNLK